MEYLKKELYELIKKDPYVFDFIQEWAMDGLSYRDLEKPGNEWFNPNFCKALGYDPKVLANKNTNWQKNIHSKDSKIIKELNNSDCTSTDIPFDEILRYKNSKEKILSIRCRGIVIKNKEGKNIRILSVYTRIRNSKTKIISNKKTEKKLRELKKKEAFFEKYNSVALIGYWELDLITQTAYWSKVTKEIHEVSINFVPSVEEGINFYQESESREKINNAVNLAISEGKPYDLELQLTTAKGNSKWIRTICQTIFLDGICQRIYGTFQDITSPKETHLELIKEKEKLNNVLESTNTGTWQWNIQTGATNYNEIWAGIIGYSLEELKPLNKKTWDKLVHPDDLKLSDEKLIACFEKKEDHYISEYRMKHKNGHWIWVLDKGKVISWARDNKPLMMFGTHTDITEQKKEIERNTLFIEQTPTAIAMFDTNMNYLASSDKWKDDYDLKDKEIIGKSHYAIFPNIKEEWKKIHQECLTDVTKKSDEDKYIDDNGNLRWLKWEVKPWYNINDTVGGLIIYTVDITSRKKIDEQLRINEEIFRGNFENAAIGMALSNKKGNWIKVNKSLCNILGYSEQELMKHTFLDITHPDDLEKDQILAQELISGKRLFYHMEKRYVCKNGRIINTILAASLVRDQEKKPLYFITQIIDITPQKKAEKELALSLSKTQGILDASTQVSIIGTDLNGEITTFNKGAENLLGYKKEEVLNKKTPLIFHLKEELEQRGKELSEEFNDEIEDFEVLTFLANKGKYDTREWIYVKKDKNQFPVQLTVTPIKIDQVIVGYLAIAVDISTIKKVEREIQSLLHVTKDQNERLKNFAHIVSHNLRSHSGNIAMMLDLLFYENPSLAENEILKLLEMASNNLKEAIAHLNEVVQMNTSITESLQNLGLKDYMDTTIKNVSALAYNANVTIYNQIDPDIKIQGIPAYLESVLINFITNGIKYRSEERDSYVKVFNSIENEFVILHIEDNGIGIDMTKNRDKIFGMYKTFHDNEDARGIGLFISKNQIEAMGGKIQVDSEVNKGTTFKIYFKYEKN